MCTCILVVEVEEHKKYREKVSMPQHRLDIIGKRFGKLVVESYAELRGNSSYYNCICDCGNHKVIRGKSLVRGDSTSCGCKRAEVARAKATTHGMTNTTLFHIWSTMKQRCYYKKKDGYAHYGGRGITVCDEWKNDFMTFYNWAMSNGYSDDLSIDRIDVNGNYEPSNCRWATIEEQSNNKRYSHYITYQNETLTIAQWSKRLGLPDNIISHRIKSGWSVEEALTTPVKAKVTYTYLGEELTLPKIAKRNNIKYQRLYSYVKRQNIPLEEAIMLCKEVTNK